MSWFRSPVATSVPTVGTFLTWWLAEIIQPNRAPLTYATYETFVRRYIARELSPVAKTREYLDDIRAALHAIIRMADREEGAPVVVVPVKRSFAWLWFVAGAAVTAVAFIAAELV